MQKFLMAAGGGALAGLLATTQIVAPLLAETKAAEPTVYEQLDLFGDVFERVRAQYVEEVEPKALIEAAINGMLISLDPHSSYLSANDFAEMKEQTKGEFGGLGLEVTLQDGFVKVIAPMDGTPASKAGIEAGDFIVQVDGESVQDMTLDQAVDKMRGPVGSEVVLTIVRDGVTDQFDVSIIRDTIKLTAVKARLVGDIGVLRISSFNEQTQPGLDAGMKKLIEEAGGMDKLHGFVIDLRNNPGGLLGQAISVSDSFLDAGEIVSTRGRDETKSERYNATPGDQAEGKPLVVLINGGSASASEIVAGALQDHARAVVVGTRSFGKGSVQSLIPVKGEGAMRLTTARYYTPSGRSIQALGVMPDIVVNQPPKAPEGAEGEEAGAAKEEKRRSEADLRGAISNDSMTEDERKKMEEDRALIEATAKLRDEDYQLAYAVDILRGLHAVTPKP